MASFDYKCDTTVLVSNSPAEPRRIAVQDKYAGERRTRGKLKRDAELRHFGLVDFVSTAGDHSPISCKELDNLKHSEIQRYNKTPSRRMEAPEEKEIVFREKSSLLQFPKKEPLAEEFITLTKPQSTTRPNNNPS